MTPPLAEDRLYKKPARPLNPVDRWLASLGPEEDWPSAGPDDDQRYEDGREHEPPPPPDVVLVVMREVGGTVVVGVGVPGREHPSADAATRPATIRTGPRRDRGPPTWALIGR